MPINFPSTPANGDIFIDSGSGNRYTWINAYSYWSYTGANLVGSAANTNVLFSDGAFVNGSAAFTFNRTTNTVSVGNSTVNTIIQSNKVTVSNSTANISLSVPTTTQISNGNYYLNANSSWSLVVSQPSGSNTEIQFNNSGSFAASPGFTFNYQSNTLNVSNAVNASIFSVGTSLTANSTRFVIGTAVGVQANGSLGSANQVLTSNGSTVYWADASGGGSGGGYYYGDNGAVGDSGNKVNIFRVNANTLNANVTFNSGENGSATGPIEIASGVTLTISSGARVAIV
jgi:hypothetical protein